MKEKVNVIINKIKKLMAIANDPSASDQEIQLATYRANKLMLKHKITELQLNESDNGDIIQKTMDQYYTGYLYWTFREICKYNRVAAYYQGKINSKCQFKYVGYEKEIAICESIVIPVLDYLERTIKELKECYIGDVDFRVYKRDYCRGFAKGIEQQLKNSFIDMNIDKKYELILTDLHPAVVDYVKEKMKIKTITRNFMGGSEDAYALGLKDGSRYNLQGGNNEKHIDLNMYRSSFYE